MRSQRKREDIMTENEVEKVDEVAAENIEVVVEEVEDEETQTKPSAPEPEVEKKESKPRTKRLKAKNLEDSPLQEMIDVNLIETNYKTVIESVPDALKEHFGSNGLPLPISVIKTGDSYLCYHGSSIIALAKDSGYTHVSSLVFEDKPNCTPPSRFLELEVHEGLDINLGDAEDILRYYF